MKMIDVTNSYPQLVAKQLESTDAEFIKVYSLGKTTVIYTEAPKHNEIVISNKSRKVKQPEIDTVIQRLVGEDVKESDLNVIHLDNLVEITIPVINEQEA